MISMSEARKSWNDFHKERGLHASFEAFAANVGAVPDHTIQTPPAAPKPKRSRMNQSMAGEFARFLASAPPPEPAPPADPILAAWQADPALAAEFGTFERFASYQRAIAAGRAHHHGASPYAA